MKPTRPQLVNLLIGKSILETLFAGALAVIVWTNAFPPTFHGWGEVINSQPEPRLEQPGAGQAGPEQVGKGATPPLDRSGGVAPFPTCSGGSCAIGGWAVNNASPWERVEVQLFIDGNLYASQVAQLSRPDVASRGWAKDEWHGYNFAVTGLAPGQHEARVYAMHRSGERITLQLLGDPIPFAVDHR